MANRIQELRLHHSLTQKQLADLIGVKPHTISQYEHGLRKPILRNVNALAKLFGVSAAFLLGLPENTDFVTVVRCWECKYACKSSVLPLVICGHGKGLVDPRPDSFCSYGERKEDSNETN